VSAILTLELRRKS